jgi:potassium channel subfamily K, other eukaryote
MVLRGIFLYLAASQGRSDTNNRDPEIGLEIRPEDTLEEAPFDDSKDIDNDKNEGAGYNTTGDPLDSNNPRGLSSATGFTAFSKSFTLVEPPTWLQKVKYFVFPPKEDIESFIPNYRYIPIISGLLIPFAILLEIPGLTEHWYIRTENNQIIERRLNPVILDVGLGISFACAVIANICLITRFLEKRVKTMTILCATFLTIHGTPSSVHAGRVSFMDYMTDLINIVAVTVFGVEHRFNDGFTYGQSFWMTVCSTIASSFTNATLIWDLSRTPDFNRSGTHI